MRVNPDISRVCWAYGQGIKGTAVVNYRKTLITRAMSSAGSPEGCKLSIFLNSKLYLWQIVQIQIHIFEIICFILIEPSFL